MTIVDCIIATQCTTQASADYCRHSQIMCVCGRWGSLGPRRCSFCVVSFHKLINKYSSFVGKFDGERVNIISMRMTLASRKRCDVGAEKLHHKYLMPAAAGQVSQNNVLIEYCPRGLLTQQTENFHVPKEQQHFTKQTVGNPFIRYTCLVLP